MMARDAGLWVGTLIIIPVLAALVWKLASAAPQAAGIGPRHSFSNGDLGTRAGPFRQCHSEGLLEPRRGRSTFSSSPGRSISRRGGIRAAIATKIAPSSRVMSRTAHSDFGARGADAGAGARAVAVGAALALGTGMAVTRVMAGAHFVSDVIFRRGIHLSDYLVCLRADLSLARTRLTDEGAERAIERAAMPGHNFLVRLFGGKPSATPK